MAETSGYTLRQLLPDGIPDMGKAVRTAQGDNADLRSKPLPGLALSIAAERATQKVLEALDTDLFEPILRAWAGSAELRKAADEADKSPDKTAVVSLGEHDLSADILPIADITFGSLGTMSLEFQLALSVSVTIADLTITERRIVKVGKTEGQASASLSFGPLSLSHPLDQTKITLHEELTPKSPPLIGPS